MNIGYTTNIEGTTNGWGGKRINGKVAYCVEHGIALGLGDNGGYTSRELTKEQLNKLTLIDYWGRYKNIANIKGCSAVNYNWDTIKCPLNTLLNSTASPDLGDDQQLRRRFCGRFERIDSEFGRRYGEHRLTVYFTTPLKKLFSRK